MTPTTDSLPGVNPFATTADHIVSTTQHQKAIESIIKQVMEPLDALPESDRQVVANELRLAIEKTPSTQACMRLAAQRCMAWQDSHTTSMRQRAQRVVAAVARAVCVSAPLSTQQRDSWRTIQRRIAGSVSDRKARLAIGMRYHRMDSDFELAAGAQLLDLTETALVRLHNTALDATYSALCAASSPSATP